MVYFFGSCLENFYREKILSSFHSLGLDNFPTYYEFIIYFVHRFFDGAVSTAEVIWPLMRLQVGVAE